jgi:hypothetical protein
MLWRSSLLDGRLWEGSDAGDGYLAIYRLFHTPQVIFLVMDEILVWSCCLFVGLALSGDVCSSVVCLH